MGLNLLFKFKRKIIVMIMLVLLMRMMMMMFVFILPLLVITFLLEISSLLETLESNLSNLLNRFVSTVSYGLAFMHWVWVMFFSLRAKWWSGTTKEPLKLDCVFLGTISTALLTNTIPECFSLWFCPLKMKLTKANKVSWGMFTS